MLFFFSESLPAFAGLLVGTNSVQNMIWNMITKCVFADKLRDVAPLVLRLALGSIFMWHGYDKVFVKGMPAIAGFLGGLGFPAPDLFAYILGYGELVFGLLMIIGLLTRLAAKFEVIVAIVAFLTVHMSNGFAISNGGYEFIMLIGAAAFSLMVTGPGKYSADAKWCHKHDEGVM